MSNPVTTSESTNLASPQFLMGLKTFMPQKPVERTIYFCTDTKEYFRFESGLWKLITR